VVGENFVVIIPFRKFGVVCICWHWFQTDLILIFIKMKVLMTPTLMIKLTTSNSLQFKPHRCLNLWYFWWFTLELPNLSISSQQSLHLASIAVSPVDTATASLITFIFVSHSIISFYLILFFLLIITSHCLITVFTIDLTYLDDVIMAVILIYWIIFWLINHSAVVWSSHQITQAPNQYPPPHHIHCPLYSSFGLWSKFVIGGAWLY
jgi:hypothetical protein